MSPNWYFSDKARTNLEMLLHIEYPVTKSLQFVVSNLRIIQYSKTQSNNLEIVLLIEYPVTNTLQIVVSNLGTIQYPFNRSSLNHPNNQEGDLLPHMNLILNQ